MSCYLVDQLCTALATVKVSDVSGLTEYLADKCVCFRASSGVAEVIQE
jgi:hypothetical protein